jgi:hypothetical protein
MMPRAKMALPENNSVENSLNEESIPRMKTGNQGIRCSRSPRGDGRQPEPISGKSAGPPPRGNAPLQAFTLCQRIR